MNGFALGDSALFGGGRASVTGNLTDDVYEYDSDLVKTFFSAVFEANVCQVNAVTIQGEIGVFAGGYLKPSDWSKNIDYYTLQ